MGQVLGTQPISSRSFREMIAIAKEKARDQGCQNVEFIAARAHDSALAEHSYDAILAFNLLHLVDDVPALSRRFLVAHKA